MATILVAPYLKAISDDAPCGDNLEYDPAFTDLERLAEGVPEQAEGDMIVRRAEEPKWRDVFDNAEELLGRSRDLRLVLYMTHAGLNLSGFPDLAAGLQLMNGLLREHWDHVHPQLDTDDNDPTLRINSLLALEAAPMPGRAEGTSFLRSLDRALLVHSKQVGTFCRRDIKLAKGELTPPKDAQSSVPQLALIEAAFQDCELSDLQATADAVRASAAAVKELRDFLLEKVGAGRAPEFTTLANELEGTRRILDEQLAERGASTSQVAEVDAPGSAVASVGAGGGDIRTREDVVRMLDRLSEYFRKYEPSSPVPLLLQRAKRLVAKDFIEILRDLTPDGVAQAEAIGGLDKEK